MFRQMFGSKLQHPDPEVRRQAIAELDAGDPRLDEAALGDDEEAVRCAALERVTEIETLTAAMQRAGAGRTRDVARTRLVEVLCAPATTDDEAAQRADWLARLTDDAELVEEVLTGASSSELRAAALSRVSSQAVLARVAANDPSGHLRAAALERVTEETLLEEISRVARNRDKGIARLARERADAARTAREQQEQLSQLVAQIGALAELPLDSTAAMASFQKLEQAWEAWVAGSGAATSGELPPAMAALRERYETHRAAIRQRLADVAECRRRRAELLRQVEAALPRTASDSTEPASASASTDPAEAGAPPPAIDADAMRSAWQQASQTTDLVDDEGDARFAALLARAEERARADAQDVARAEAVEAWLTEQEDNVRRGRGSGAGATEGQTGGETTAPTAAGADTTVQAEAEAAPTVAPSAEAASDGQADSAAGQAGETRTETGTTAAAAPTAIAPAEVRAAWDALDKPRAPALRAPLAQRFDALLASLGDDSDASAPTTAGGRRERGADQRAPTLTAEQIDEFVAALAARLDETDRHIAAGELKPATAAFDAARAVGDQLGRTGAHDGARQVRERLQATSAKLKELRSWRRWSTDRARETLCEEVEQLIGAEQDPAALARTIRGYREKWKKLDKAEGGASKPLWERFNTACTKAYEPCRQHFAAEADRRNENLTAKVALLEAMEALEADTDWDGTPDWPAIDRAMGQFRRDWRNLGPVNRRDNKKLMERHDTIRAKIDARLRPVREAELERRRAIVARLAEIAEAEDLRGAADEAKRAQAEWTPLVRAPRKVEQGLWTDLRAACDRIFERLRERRERQHGERSAALEASLDACRRVEQIADQLEPLGFRAEDRERESALLAEFAAAQEAFGAAGEIPRAREGEVRAAWRKACDRVETARRQRRRSRQLQGLAGLAERAAVIDRLEQAVLAGEGSAAADEAQAAWETLAPADDKGLAAVTARYDLALAAARGDDTAVARLRDGVERTLDERRELMLALEIAVGVDSPTHLQQQRMAYQVNLLQASMTGGDHNSPARIEQMLRQWFALGPVPAAQAGELAERFERVQGAALHPRRGGE